MHQSSYDKMTLFREKYLSGKEDLPLTIVDLGSTNIYGCYRPIFDATAWNYTGVDLAPGDNVDLVLSDPYNWLEIDSESADIFVSGQTFEHIEYFWKTMLEISRILKPGGICCIIAPSGGPEHKYPVDCWRFYPDGFEALARYVNFEILDVGTSWNAQGYSDDSHLWADTMLVAKKPEKLKVKEEAHQYDREIVSDAEDSLAKISGYIKPDSCVLELGPARGYYTKYLKEQLNCTVDCVEISPAMAEEAKEYCRKMVVANLDDSSLKDFFSPGTYDFILMADILEHLRHGEKILNSCKDFLTPQGKLIVSVPNIAHSSILGCLFEGQFEYRDQGLLDKTHIKFFTRDSITSLLCHCGYDIEAIETVTILPEDTQIGDSLMNLPTSLQKMILNRKDALTYQFVLVCRQSAGENGKGVKHHIRKVAAVDLRRACLNSLNQRIAELDIALENAGANAERLNDDISEIRSQLTASNEKLALEKQASRERLEEISKLKKHVEEQNKTINHCQSIINRIETHPLYRIYRKMKDFINHYRN